MQRDAATRLVREILLAMCHKLGIATDFWTGDSWEPAQNFMLAVRLGIGDVFGLDELPFGQVKDRITVEHRAVSLSTCYQNYDGVRVFVLCSCGYIIEGRPGDAKGNPTRAEDATTKMRAHIANPAPEPVPAARSDID